MLELSHGTWMLSGHVLAAAARRPKCSGISRPAHLIDQAERDKLVAEVIHRVATIAPFTIVIGSVLGYASSAIADPYPDHQLAALHTAARDGIRTTLGEDACQYECGIQHLTTAYA